MCDESNRTLAPGDRRSRWRRRARNLRPDETAAAVTTTDPTPPPGLVADEPESEEPYWTQTRRASVLLFLAHLREKEEGREPDPIFNPVRALWDAQAARLVSPPGERWRLLPDGLAVLEDFGLADPIDRQDTRQAPPGGSGDEQARELAEVDEILAADVREAVPVGAR